MNAAKYLQEQDLRQGRFRNGVSEFRAEPRVFSNSRLGPLISSVAEEELSDGRFLGYLDASEYDLSFVFYLLT